jgi:hypothetical protein
MFLPKLLFIFSATFAASAAHAQKGGHHLSGHSSGHSSKHSTMHSGPRSSGSPAKGSSRASGTGSSKSETHVRGYTKKDGTKVTPHYRSTPNTTKKDNWSTRGNVNPHTGKVGTKPPVD